MQTNDVRLRVTGSAEGYAEMCLRMSERIAILEKALAPLAYARIRDGAQDADTLVASNITVADARNARSVLGS